LHFYPTRTDGNVWSHLAIGLHRVRYIAYQTVGPIHVGHSHGRLIDIISLSVIINCGLSQEQRIYLLVYLNNSVPLYRNWTINDTLNIWHLFSIFSYYPWLSVIEWVIGLCFIVSTSLCGLTRGRAVLHPIRLSVCPSSASDFLETGKRKAVETSNLVETWRRTRVTIGKQIWSLMIEVTWKIVFAH